MKNEIKLKNIEKMGLEMVDTHVKFHGVEMAAMINCKTGGISFLYPLNRYITGKIIPEYNNGRMDIEKTITKVYNIINEQVKPIYQLKVPFTLPEDSFSEEAYKKSFIENISNTKLPSIEDFCKSLYHVLIEIQSVFLFDDSLTDWLDWLEDFLVK